MKVRGYWGPGAAPYLEARLVSKDPEIDSFVKFLIDTGASKTILMDRDAQEIGLDYSKLLKHPKGTVGIGGIVDTYLLTNARLQFLGESGLQTTEVAGLAVLRHAPSDRLEEEMVKRLPSVIGRDILNRCDVMLSYRKGVVLLRD